MQSELPVEWSILKQTSQARAAVADSFSVYTKGVEDNVFRPFVRLMTYEVRRPPAERLNTSAQDGSSFMFSQTSLQIWQNLSNTSSLPIASLFLSTSYPDGSALARFPTSLFVFRCSHFDFGGLEFFCGFRLFIFRPSILALLGGFFETRARKKREEGASSAAPRPPQRLLRGRVAAGLVPRRAAAG